MEHFLRKTDDFFPLPVKVVGVLFGIAGLASFLGGFLPGLGLIILSIFALFSHNGFILDAQNLKYKEYGGLLGLKWGKWKPLPTIKRITITNENISFRNQSHGTGLSTYSKSSKAVLSFIISDRELIVVAKGNYKNMMDDALLLSKKLNLEVLDATSKEKKIINASH